MKKKRGKNKNTRILLENVQIFFRIVGNSHVHRLQSTMQFLKTLIHFVNKNV